MKVFNIYILDDYKIAIEGIASFLIGSDKYTIAQSFQRATSLLQALKKKQPEILILDIKLPKISGIEIAKIVSKNYPQIKIIFLSSNTDKQSLNNAIKAGGKAYLSKDISENEFVLALDTVCNNESYFSLGIQQVLFNNFTENSSVPKKQNPSVLTNREIEVISLIAEGLSFKEIAKKLSISSRTVETHKKNMLEKLELKTTIDLVKYAILNGFATL